MFTLSFILGCVLLLILCLTSQKFTPCRDKLSPVIFIPGDGGSRLEISYNRNDLGPNCTKLDWYTTWLNVTELIFTPNCWADNLMLEYDKVTRKTRNPAGVDIRVPGWGDPEYVENLTSDITPWGKYFDDIADMLVKDLGYVRQKSLRAAPYDFRKGPSENEEYFVKLRKLVEETYEINGREPITLMAHSMGAPMSLIFLNRQSQSWKNRYVKSLITLNGVWGGAAKALKVLAVGDNFGSNWISRTIIRKQLVSMPSLGWLLPRKHFWDDDDVLVETPFRNYTLVDMPNFLANVTQTNGWEFFKDNERFLADFEPPRVEVHCLHGTSVNTIERLLYQDLNDDPRTLLGDGDGTVNLRSLLGCTRWKERQTQSIHHQTFTGIDHMGILNDENTIEYLKGIINKGTTQNNMLDRLRMRRTII